MHPIDTNVVMRTELEELRTQYYQLIYEVGQKHEGESRHDTARRYIRERENRIECPGSSLPNAKNPH